MRAGQRNRILRLGWPVALLLAVGAGCLSARDPAGVLEPGGIRVQVTTEGEDLDPDGYLLRVVGVGSAPVGILDVVEFNEVPVGIHELIIEEVAPNCVPEGGSEQEVIVQQGIFVEVDLLVTCSRL